MKKPLVSVVMTAYNVEEYISQAIESILNQTFNDFEFIIIDDCSTDNTYNIIQKYASQDNRIRVYHNSINLKIVTSLNIGIKKATGEYIARFDADDISMIDRLEKQVKFLEHNEDISVVGSAAVKFYRSTNNIIEYYNVLEKHDDIKVWLFLYGALIVHPTIMIRSDVLKKYLYNIEYNQSAEDYDLWIRMLNDGVYFANIKEPLIYYRMRNGQLTDINKNNIDAHAKTIIEDQLKKLLMYAKDRDTIIRFHFEVFLAPFTLKTIYYWLAYHKHIKTLLEANRVVKLFNEGSLLEILKSRYIPQRIIIKIKKVFTK